MIADKIKNARTIKKLTQEQVAEDLNVSRQTISNWENGKSLPDIVSIIRMSELYDLQSHRDRDGGSQCVPTGSICVP